MTAPVTLPREEVTIDRLVAGGDGLGRLSDGRVVFVPNVAPGDCVAIELSVSKKDLARGQVMELITAGPGRTTPPCARVAAGCGGCDWQHLSAQAQHEAKLALVVDAFTRIGRMSEQAAHIRFGGGVASRAAMSGWRTTVRATVDSRGRAGFFASGTHSVVPSGQCLVAHPIVSAVLEGGSFSPGDEVIVRVGTSSKQLVVGAGRPKNVVLPALPAGWSAEVVAIPGAAASGAVHENIAGANLRVSINSFFQSGPEGAALLVATVSELLAPLGAPDVFVDLYGGVGLFAATVGKTARDRVVVESASSSVADARHNLGEGVLVHRSPVEDWEPPRVVRRATNLHLVADPARAGLGREGVAAIGRARPSAVVLVSCDAAAGARDARLLAEAGYELREGVVLDLFPHTSHVEVVTLYTPAVAD